MDQADRDRLVSLKKAKKKLITEKEAAGELGITERQVRRLLRKWKKHGDKAVVHALRGEPSNRKTDVIARSHQDACTRIAKRVLRRRNECRQVEPSVDASLAGRRIAVRNSIRPLGAAS